MLRLEDGDRLPEVIERFAEEHAVHHGLVFYLGGAADGSRLVVGPRPRQPGEAIVPIVHTLSGSQEVLAVGTLVRNEAARPVLHLHAAVGREGGATVGCTRAGVEVWLVGEVVILELGQVAAERRRDAQSGLELLEVGGA
jgi:predicted DNA-binding protein with PD1-like motif